MGLYLAHTLTLLFCATTKGVLAIQAVIANVNGKILHSPFWSTALSFFVGCLFLLVLLLLQFLSSKDKSLFFSLKVIKVSIFFCFPVLPSPLQSRISKSHYVSGIQKGKPRPRNFLPAFIGIGYVFCSVFCTIYLGFALFFVALVCGQLLTSAVLDHTGYGRPVKIPLSFLRVCALALAIVGACLSVANAIQKQFTGGATTYPVWVLILCFLLSFLFGSGLPIQVAWNIEMMGHTRSMTKTLGIMFTIAAAVMGIIVGGQTGADAEVRDNLPTAFSLLSWYSYTPGIIGVSYVLISIRVTSLIGSAPFFVCLVCGQLIGSLIVDSTEFLGTPVKETTALRVVGVSVVIIASILVQVSGGKQVFDKLLGK